MRLPIISTAVAIAAAVFQSGAAEREVAIENPAAGITLAGTLSTPSGNTPRAAVVLASGSGAQDRDETILGHKPFKIIADSLSAAGIAVLRFDDRGTGSSTGRFEGATRVDFDTDIAAVTRWLDSTFTSIPVGIIGHSEGGASAIALAGRPEVDFIVTLAAPAWRGDSIIMSQTRAIATAATGRWDKESTQRSLLDIARSGMPPMFARVALMDILKKEVGEAANLPDVQRRLDASVDALLSPGYRYLLRYDPAAEIAAVAVPWLALNGDRDTQILPGNLETIRELNPAAVTILLPGLNHLFQQSATGLPTTYATDGPVMAPAAISAVISFIHGL